MSESDPTAFDYDGQLAAVGRGDRRALQAIYAREGGRMLAVALRIVRDHGRAEDIVHDACLNIWTRAASFEPARGSGRGWIYSVVRHLALNAVRDGAREVPADDATTSAMDQRDALVRHRDAADTLIARLDRSRLLNCLERLDPARRDCVLHAYVDGCSHGEIAQRVGAPLGTVKAWIRRSLASLRECMA